MTDQPNRWSQEITEEDRHDVGRGVFSTGTPQEIADAVIAAARDEAGRNLSSERRETLEKAKAIVRESA